MVRIAAAQIPITANIQENLTTILNAIKRAAHKNADFICLPEICLVNEETNFPPITKETNQIRNAAKQHHINIIFGTYAREKEHIRNQIWIINKQGTVVYKYNKKYAYLTEKSFLKEGRRNKVITLDKTPFAVINCWDYAYPEHIRKLAKQGAKIIFCPSYLMSYPQTHRVLDKIPQVRAFDTMSYFVMVDGYSDETFKRTKICSPFNELARIHNKPGIVYADLDLKTIDKLRKQFVNL